MVISEAAWQQQVIETAKWYGWRHCHVRKASVRKGRIATPTSVPGWPDLVLWNPTRGGVIFVELKTDGGRVSVEQIELLASLKDAGARAEVWRPRMLPQIQEILSGGAVRGSEGDGPHQQGKAAES